MNKDYKSFRNAMADIGEAFYRQSMEQDGDVVVDEEYTSGNTYHCSVSAIHEEGIFSAMDCDYNGDHVCTLINKDGRRTMAGRFINHAHTPNVAGEIAGDELVAVVIRPIKEGDEITIDYGRLEAVRLEFARMMQERE